MNGVSDLDLALAVQDAGAMPSLLVSVRDSDHRLALDAAHSAVERYRAATGHTNLVFSVHHDDLLEPEFLRWLDWARPSHIEFLGYDSHSVQHCFDARWPIIITRIKKFAKIMVRCIQPGKPAEWADALCVKGRESAGFSSQFRVVDIVRQQLIDTPDLAIIPYGGVGTAQQVKQYLTMGASAVACGSIFAASQESRLSKKVKQRIVDASLGDLVTFSDTGQQALPLGPIQSIMADDSNWNREHSLMQGIHGDGTVGHIYMGESVQYINSIRSVKDIVDDLVNLL